MSHHHSNGKYAWQKTPRVDPPKRAARERTSDFREIYSLLDEETIRQQASRCVQCAYPFCRTGCPLGNRIPEWLACAAAGDFLEAAALSRSTSNMPEICSRVCPQERLCEGACALNARSEPVPIGAIEKFINEYALRRGVVEVTNLPPNGLRIAIVGSGPAGIACADELAARGYEVMVFEALSRLGGLLVNGIPAFKLEKSVVERRLELLRQRGVVFRTGVTVGQELSLSNLLAEFNAVFLGIGAQKPKPLDISGAQLKGVHDALPFLIEKNVGISPGGSPIVVKDQRVAVLGGGDTAMDCLRTAIRCGAREAVCLYRRDLANMPGSRREYQSALEEGAIFQFLTNPVSLGADADGRVTHVGCVRMELGEPDAKGRRKPFPVPGSDFLVETDMVLVAYGFDPVPFPPGNDLAAIQRTDWGGLIVDANQMTSRPGVFSGGDMVRGPSLVVDAVRDGRRAALGIHHYLSQRQAPTQRRDEPKECVPV